METVEKDALGLYRPPFRYQYGYIFDADSNMVGDDIASAHLMEVRGWGRISYKEDPERLQDSVGEHIANALTEYWDGNTDTLLDELTYDKVADEMKGFNFDPDDCELGEVMCAVRKIIRRRIA